MSKTSQKIYLLLIDSLLLASFYLAVRLDADFFRNCWCHSYVRHLRCFPEQIKNAILHCFLSIKLKIKTNVSYLISMSQCSGIM